MSERPYAPRSGGRTAEQRSSTETAARRYPTEGAAALKAEAAEPSRVTERTTPRLRVAPPAPISAPRAPFIAVVIALVVAGVLGILLINTKTNENTFQISKLQDKQTALTNQEQALRNKVAGFESTGNLDAAARRLGLVKADNPAYIRLPDGKVLRVPRPGSGARAVTAQDPADTTGAADTDGDTQNGVTAAGGQQGGTVHNGAVQDGTVQGGPAQTGSTQGGTVPGGTVPGGTVPGGTVPGGNAPGGNAVGAANQAGAPQSVVDQSAG